MLYEVEVEKIEDLPSPIEIPNILGNEYQIEKIKGFYEKRSLSDIEEKSTKQKTTSKNQLNDKRQNNTSPSIVGHFLTIQVKFNQVLFNITSQIRLELSNMNFLMTKLHANSEILSYFVHFMIVKKIQNNTIMEDFLLKGSKKGSVVNPN